MGSMPAIAVAAFVLWSELKLFWSFVVEPFTWSQKETVAPCPVGIPFSHWSCVGSVGPPVQVDPTTGEIFRPGLAPP